MNVAYAGVRRKPVFREWRQPKQIQLCELIGKNRFILAYGGGRSGKTLTFLYAIIVRALAVKSDHLVARYRFSHAKRAICFQSIPRLLKILREHGVFEGADDDFLHLNKTEWYYELPNGSRIWIGGFDEGDRAEKILGNDYATIFLNEASEDPYETFDLLLNRMVAPAGMRSLMFLDYNPPSQTHWGYKIFHERVFPDGRPVPEDDFASIQMNPSDNGALPAEYSLTLALMSAERRRRFEQGEYSLDQGALWKRSMIQYHPGALPDFHRVVIGHDPTGSVEGDEVGIVAAGAYTYDGLEKFVVLDDASFHGTPREWSDETASLYDKWKADVIAAERNFGGDMVSDVLTTGHRHVNVKLVTSSRGKIVRAEPISALYERKLVTHRVPFLALEDELCMYDPAKTKKSPNRMDALVFALSELTSSGVSMLDVL